jgi:hypothetical protein
VQALWRSGHRSGAIAIEVAGVERPAVRDALREQTQARMAALFEIAATRGHDAVFEAGAVPLGEVSVRMPLGALLRGMGTPATPPTAPARAPVDRSEARRKLRALAKSLHPDRHLHLDPVTRRGLEQRLAEATAAYHGLSAG